MKTSLILSCLAVVLTFSSCTKEAPADPNATSFQYTINNTVYKWGFDAAGANLAQGAVIKRSFNPNTNQPAYTLNAWSDPDKISLQCLLNTTVLSLGTFNVTTDISDPFVNSFYKVYDITHGSVSGDLTSVTITKISGQRISGYFSTVVHSFVSPNTEVRIYEGYFNNILIQE